MKIDRVMDIFKTSQNFKKNSKNLYLIDTLGPEGLVEI